MRIRHAADAECEIDAEAATMLSAPQRATQATGLSGMLFDVAGSFTCRLAGSVPERAQTVEFGTGWYRSPLTSIKLPHPMN